MDKMNKTTRINRELNRELKIKLLQDDRIESYQELSELLIKAYANDNDNLNNCIDQMLAK